MRSGSRILVFSLIALDPGRQALRPIPVDCPHVVSGERVVLFDGVCSLCSAWTRFLIQRDPAGKFKLCSIQSPQGRDILSWAGVPLESINTMVYVADGRAVLRSSAFLLVMRDLGFPWALLSIFRIVPAFIRDFFYGLIAENRYSLFGQTHQCMMPAPEDRKRFIDITEKPV